MRYKPSQHVFFDYRSGQMGKTFISPTHKRTEGRAPVWGSEFTSKDAALQGDPAETAARLNLKLRDLRDWWWCLFFYPL
jgi:hypothetical protein